MATRSTTTANTATRAGRARTNPTRSKRSDAPGGPRNRNAGGRADANRRQREGAQGGGRREREASRQQQQQQQSRGVGGVVDTLRNAGLAVGGGITAHPVPVALIGTGLAWLLLESRVSDAGGGDRSALLERARSRFEEVSEGVTDAVGSALESAKDSLSSGADAVRGGLSGAAETVADGTRRLGEATQEGARAVGSTLREGAAAVGEGGRRGYEYTRQAAAKTWDQHPLVSGLSLLAAGVAIGMLLPPVRSGTDSKGRRPDSLTQRIKTAGTSLVERGQRVASSLLPGSETNGAAGGGGSPPAEKKRQGRRK